MTGHSGQTQGFERISAMMDVEKEMEILEDSIELAARLMVTFIDPGSGDADGLETIARKLATATSEAPPDIAKVDQLLKRALAMCFNCGWLAGDTEVTPWHLTHLMLQAVSDGDRLRNLVDSSHAAQQTADTSTRDRQPQG